MLSGVIEKYGGSMRIRIEPEVIWSWGLNADAEARFRGVERRTVARD